MRILGIESAANVASAAILTDGVITAEYSTNFKKTHSETLLPMVSEIMKMTGVEPSELDAIAVSMGPGSFTGLRIGAAAAKGLAMALDIPMIAVPTVDAMAYGCYGSQFILAPLMDARRNQVYTGLYEFNGTEFIVHKPAYAIEITDLIREAEVLAKEKGKAVMYLGDGLPVFKEQIAKFSEGPYAFSAPHIQNERAAAVASLGAVMFEKGETVSALEFLPLYLRESQAERERREAGLPTEG